MSIARAQFSSSSTGFASITGTFANIKAATSDVTAVILSNATDAAIDVSLDGWVTNYATPNFFISVPIGQAIVVPLGDSDICATVSLDIRHQGAAPTVRNFSATFIRKRN